MAAMWSLGGQPGLDQDQHGRQDEQHRADDDEHVADSGQLEGAPMPTRNSTAARNTVIRTYSSPTTAAWLPTAAALGLAVQFVGLGLAGELVLGHVGGPGRGTRVVERVGGHPGVEGDDRDRDHGSGDRTGIMSTRYRPSTW
jgi:hypothetical protein